MIQRFCIVFLAVLLGGKMNAQVNAQERARAFVKQLEQGQYAACYAAMDTVISNRMSTEDLQAVWEKLSETFGVYKGYSDVREERRDTLLRVILRCQFERSSLDMNLVYAPSEKIVGFSFTPAKSTKSYSPPDYFDPSKYYENNLNVKTGKYSLPAILTLPNGIKDPPVVILLAGSGPNDRDETIGPNKPLKDIAMGLANRGIASLRYDKRTHVYAAEIAKDLSSFGIEEEVIQDALSAIDLVRHQPATKKSKIIIAGHSLGGMCAPVVASRSKEVQGVIFLAANARPLEDLLVEQYTYLLGLDSLDANDRGIIDTLQLQVKRVKDPQVLKTAAAKDLPLGLPSYYWQSLKKIDNLKTAQGLKQPILVLQGKRDYQVTLADFDLWEQRLNTNTKNEFAAYEGLNHLFIEGEGICKPEEYDQPGHVKEEVMKDMSEWIKSICK